MNACFGHHALVTLESNGDFITLRTLDAQHGRSHRMFMDSDRLYRWLEEDDGSSFMDYDCGSFMVMHRRNQTVHLHQTWAESDWKHDVRGYTQDFELPVDDLLAVVVAGIKTRRLAALESHRGQAVLTITNGAHRQIRKLDRTHRRAVSKALRDGFAWKDSHVCLYADWDKDFSFVDQRISGGLCLHECHVIGKDGKPHRKLHYQIHT